MRKVPASMLLVAAFVAGVLPFLIGWLASYELSADAIGYVALGSLIGAAVSLVVWIAAARRAGIFWLTIGQVVLAWVLALAGARFVGAWLYLALWNPAWPPPFMTQGYSVQQGLIGLAIWAIAILPFLLAFRRGPSPG